MYSKTVVFRIVTSNYCVSTHLRNTLLRVPNNLHLFVLGDNVEIFSKQFPNVSFKNIPLERKFHLIRDLISLFLIVKLILKYRPKVVHSLMTKAGLYSSIISFFLSVDIRVHTFTGQVWVNRQGLVRYLLKYVDRIICRLNTHCFTDSKSQSEFLFENGISHKGMIIPFMLNGSISGVDIIKFNKDDLKNDRVNVFKKYNISDDEFVLGYIARKSVDKGCIDMLQIFFQLLKKIKNKKLKLFFIGPDESKGELLKFYKSKPDLLKNIIELGFVNNHFQFISACNLMCLPSHREGFGSIVIDAAAIGVPTVGYNIPGLADSICDKYSGILVPFGDIDAFVNEIVDLIYNSKKLNEISLNSRKYVVENFDADLVNHELFNFYLNVK